MQNTNNTNNVNPENFPETIAKTQTTTARTGNILNTTAEQKRNNQASPEETETQQEFPQRIQNLSFATNYNHAPGRYSYSPQHQEQQSHKRYTGTVIPTSEYSFEPLVAATAFSVLQNEDDYLQYSYSAGKPNAIVRPIRRAEQQPQTANPHHVSHISYNVVPDMVQEENARADGVADDNATVTNQNANAGRNYFSRSGQEARSFADELNHKLRFLQPEENYGTAWSRSRNTYDPLSQRPRFVTTVPTGIFLPPAQELQYIPASVFRRQIYAYSSYPIVLNSYYNNNNNNNCNPYTKNASKIFYTMPKDNTRQTTTATEMQSTDKDIRINTAHLNGIRSNAKTNGAHVSIGLQQQLQSQLQIQTQTQQSQSQSQQRQPRNIQKSTITASTSNSTSQASALAGGVHITKEQFQQQLQHRRAKREVNPSMEPYKNVMYDKRVIKGSNFGIGAMISEVDPFDKAAELRRRNMLRKRSIQCRNQRNILGTPPPVKGRKHETIQTEKYLEKLVQKPSEFSVDTQTDLFLEKPPTPPYVPAKVGIDVATEIGEGELFHFDAEAQPIIDVLVDACIEQSMLEVAHEMELDALRKKQEEYLAQREIELAELRRLEAEELRLQAEKERRLRQDQIAKELDAEMQKSVTAAKLLQGHIASLVPEVLENIEPATDAVKKEQLFKNICPWLSAEVAEEVGHIVDSREILTAIIQEIIKQRAETYAGYKEEFIGSEPLPLDVCEEQEFNAEQEPTYVYPCETETSYEECSRVSTPPLEAKP